MMKQQADLVAEETLLEYNAKQLGARVMKTPQCCPELTGERIECHWVLTKFHYCRLPMNEKKGERNFLRV